MTNLSSLDVARSEPFFVAGGALPPDSPSYVARQADDALFAALVAGEYCHLLSSFQMGKTSLCLRTARRLKEEGIQCAVVDLGRIGAQNATAEQWYAGLLTETGKALNLRWEFAEHWRQRQELPPVQRYFTALREVALAEASTSGQAALEPEEADPCIVIFLDEIDTVRSLPFPTEEFFAAIRACHDSRKDDPDCARLTFCLSGRAAPAEIVADGSISPFNVGTSIELTDFTLEEAAALAGGFQRRNPPGQDESAESAAESSSEASTAASLAVSPAERKSWNRLLQQVLAWTGGQPYLTQRLCLAVEESGLADPGTRLKRASRSSAGSRKSGNGQPAAARTERALSVDSVCREVFLTPAARETDANLTHIRSRLLQSGLDLTPLLGLYRTALAGGRVPEDPSSPLHAALKFSGITRVENGLLKVRCRIYREVFDAAWVEQNMPGAEQRRERQAYRRGMRRAGALMGLAALAAAGIAAYAFWDRDRKERQADSLTVQARRSEAMLYSAELNLVSHSIASGDLGRARQLLESQLQSDSRRDMREFTWRWLWSQCQSGSMAVYRDHRQPVRVVAFSPDGKTVASAGADREIHLLDVPSMGLRTTLRGHASTVTGLYFTADGAKLISGAADGAILWSVPTGKALARIAADASRMAVSRDGRRIVTAGQAGPVTVWDSARLFRLSVLQINAALPALSVGLSPDGTQLITTHGDGMVQVRSVFPARPLRTLAGHTGAVTASAYSRDGRMTVTAGRDGTVRLWDARSGGAIAVFEARGETAHAVAFSPDGRFVAMAGANGVRIWNAASRTEIRQLAGHAGAVRGVAFSPTAGLAVTGGDDKEVRLWSWRADALTALAKHTGGRTIGTLFSPDGAHFAAASSNGDVVVGETRTARPVARLRRAEALNQSIAFLPDGRLAAAQGDMNEFWLWDWRTGKVENRPCPEPVWKITVSRNGTIAATAGNRSGSSIRILEIVTGKPLQEWPSEASELSALEISPDGRRVAEGYSNGSVIVRDVKTGKKLTETTAHTARVTGAAFSPDAQSMATTGFDGSVRFWETRTWKSEQVYGSAGEAWSPAFSFDGKTLATGSADGTVILWSPVTRQTLAVLPGRRGPVLGTAFSPDGRRLAAASASLTWMWTAPGFDSTDAGERQGEKSQ